MQPAPYKPKLPGHLSFPIGFEAISSGLAAVPFANEIQLSFVGTWSPYVRARIDANDSYAIAVANFEKWDKRLGVEFGGSLLHAGRWKLWVYPVRRELKSTARTMIVQIGLPALAEWFCTKRPESWYWGKKQWELIFKPKAGTIEVRTEILRV